MSSSWSAPPACRNRSPTASTRRSARSTSSCGPQLRRATPNRPGRDARDGPGRCPCIHEVRLRACGGPAGGHTIRAMVDDADDGVDTVRGGSPMFVLDETRLDSPSARHRSDTRPPPSIEVRYRFGEVLGEGGMGEGLLAHDEHIGREVAVKRIRSTEPSAEELSRFLREARVQGRLEHPAVVPVHDLAVDRDGRPFFVMKRLTGTTMLELLARLRAGGEADDAAAR